MKKIVVLATTHECQINGNSLNSEFEKRLEYLKLKFAAQTIMEEWSTKNNKSFADQFAADRSLHWTNVGTPNEKRFKTFYGPINFPGHEGTFSPDWDAPTMNEYGPIKNQENREQWMVKKIKTEMQTFEQGILILGLAHLHSLCAKLFSCGFEVHAYSWIGGY